MSTEVSYLEEHATMRHRVDGEVTEKTTGRLIWARFDTTAYGEVKPAVDDAREHTLPAHAEQRSRRDDRWTIRRSALSRQLVLDAQEIFTRRLQRPVSENDARNMLGNLADYVWMLVQWEVSGADPTAQEQEKKQPASPRGRPKKSDPIKRKPSRRAPPT